MFSVFLCCILCLKDGWNDNLPVSTKQHFVKNSSNKIKLLKQLKGPERNVFSRPESPESASCTIEVECWIQNRKMWPLFDSDLERASAFNRLAFGVVVEVDEGHHDLGKILREWGSERFSSLVSYFCRHLGLKIVSGNLNLKIIKWAPQSIYLSLIVVDFLIEKLIPKKINPMMHQLHLHLNGVHLPAMVRSVSLGDKPTSVRSLVSKEMASSWSPTSPVISLVTRPRLPRRGHSSVARFLQHCAQASFQWGLWRRRRRRWWWYHQSSDWINYYIVKM